MNTYRFFLAVVGLVTSFGAYAQFDPCHLINPVYISTPEGGCAVSGSASYSTSVYQPILNSSLQVRLLGAQLVSQRQLAQQFADLVTIISALKQSIDNLNTASSELKASNETWRAATLEEAMRGIRALPLAVAREPALPEAVGSALLSDPKFVDRLRTALAK